MTPAPGGRRLAAALPPVRDVRFWLTQALVVAVFGAHVAAHVTVGGTVEVLVPAAYAFPVLYAALEFGRRGSIATTALVVLLTLPYVIDDALTGSTSDFAGHLTELIVLIVVAPVVGAVVEQERAARRAHEAAEVRYRALFEAGGVPALVLDEDGTIQEANPAARTVLRDRLEGRRLGDVLGEDAAAAVLRGSVPETLELPEGLELSLVVSPVERLEGPPLLQVLFRDVTEEAAGARRTRTFALAVLVAQEDERRRIAQELHDEALQLVVELRRRIDRAARRQAGDTAELASARSLADEVIDELRTVALRLRPAELDDLGLTASLERLVDDARHRGLAASLAVDPVSPAPSPAAALALYRVAQEALTNAEHHARPTAVTVRLAAGDEDFQLEVRDDGVGFDPARLVDAGRDGHLGLLGMRERLELVGGALRVDSAPGQGTTVVARVPRADAPTPVGPGAHGEASRTAG